MLNLSYFSLGAGGNNVFYFYRLVNTQKKKFRLETTQRFKTKFFFRPITFFPLITIHVYSRGIV